MATRRPYLLSGMWHKTEESAFPHSNASIRKVPPHASPRLTVSVLGHHGVLWVTTSFHAPRFSHRPFTFTAKRYTFPCPRNAAGVWLVRAKATGRRALVERLVAFMYGYGNANGISARRKATSLPSVPSCNRHAHPCRTSVLSIVQPNVPLIGAAVSRPQEPGVGDPLFCFIPRSWSKSKSLSVSIRFPPVSIRSFDSDSDPDSDPDFDLDLITPTTKIRRRRNAGTLDLLVGCRLSLTGAGAFLGTVRSVASLVQRRPRESTLLARPTVTRVPLVPGIRSRTNVIRTHS